MKSIEFSYSQQLPVLGLFILLFCPVLHGCEPLHCTDGDFTAAGMVPVKVTVHSETSLHGQSLDMLIFSDDDLQYMECWQRVPVRDGDKASIASISGDKILMACSGMTAKSHEDWMWVSSLASLSDAWTDLENETSDFPVMSGSCTFKAGSTLKEQPKISLRRVSGEIHLRSLCCDFSGRAYEGEKLSDVQVYLTNVSASGMIWDESGRGSRIINQGRLVMEDVSRFNDRSLVWQRIDGEVGNTKTDTDIRLRCYPNIVPEDGPGSPYTRLVIQGVLDGEVWYWPIDINRGNGSPEEGIRRNHIYTYDIVLTRKGSADPDTGIKTGVASITMEVDKWEDKEEYSVRF